MFQKYRFYRKNPDLVLVDTEVIAQAPPRLLVAGMGDVLATWFEARTCVAGTSRTCAAAVPPPRGRPGRALLQDPHRRRRGRGARRRDPGRHPGVERLVEANTLLPGLGFESSGLAAAHAVHNGLTVAARYAPLSAR